MAGSPSTLDDPDAFTGILSSAMSVSVIGVDQLDLAAVELAEGRLVAIPTETVYGLGADASSGAAVKGIFAAKGRPDNHPLIVHVHDSQAVEAIAESLSDSFYRLAEAFWPGPLTVIVRRRLVANDDRPVVAPETVGGRPTIAVRVPDHPVTLDLLARFAEVGSGLIAAPSANRFGSISPTTAAHVVDDELPGLGLVVDGGPCRVGVESTIVDLTGPKPELLRPGGISTVELEAVIGPVADGRLGDARASGMLESHYAPNTSVELVEAVEEDDLASVLTAEAKIGVVAPFACRHEPHWEMPTDAGEYAARLYSVLRSADLAGVERIVVVPPRSGSLLDAVLDRLTKAAA